MTTISILPIVQFAAATTFSMSIILIGIIAAIRVQAIRQAQRQLATIWGPRFANPTAPLPLPLPRPRKADQLAVLSLWNTAYDAASTDHKRQLETLALHLSFHRDALTHLQAPNLDARLLAIMTVGRLRVSEAWSLLEDLPAHPNPILSFAATRALFAIDPDRAVQRYVRFLFRPDWSATKVAECLQEVEETLLAQIFTRWLRQTRSIPQAIRLIRYLGATRCVPALPDLRQYLDAPGRHTRVLAEGLHTLSYFKHREDGPRFRAAATSAHWYLRVRAAIGLGLVGTTEDFPLLTTLLRDPHWWVRYRAAEAITRLRGTSRDTLQTLLAQQTDLYAQNALHAFVVSDPPKRPGTQAPSVCLTPSHTK